MDSRLTVADVRRAIGSLFHPDKFLSLLNQAEEAIINSGRWDGSQVFVTFNSSSGFITLDYRYSALLGINLGSWVPPIYSQNHPYIEGGPGRMAQTMNPAGVLMDLGDTFCTVAEPATDGSTLRIVLDNAADVGKPIRINAVDSNGVEWSDGDGLGITVTPTGITTNIATTVSLNNGRAITGIQTQIDPDTEGSPTMRYNWSLYAVAPTTSALTFLSRYYPSDTRPTYRRYQTGIIGVSSGAGAAPSIQCLCQRRFIWAYNETDWVEVGNIQAVKAAMQAVRSSDNNIYDSPNWQIVFDTLNGQLKNHRGRITPIVPFNKMPGPGPIRFVR